MTNPKSQDQKCQNVLLHVAIRGRILDICLLTGAAGCVQPASLAFKVGLDALGWILWSRGHHILATQITRVKCPKAEMIDGLTT